jgi:hypothetical protein
MLHIKSVLSRFQFVFFSAACINPSQASELRLVRLLAPHTAFSFSIETDTHMLRNQAIPFLLDLRFKISVKIYSSGVVRDIPGTPHAASA